MFLFGSEKDAGPIPKPEVVIPRPEVVIPRSSVHSQLNIENEEAFGRFEENRNFHTDSLEYSRNGKEPGLVLIFNQENFEESSYRSGSKRDVENIVTCLTRLGFNIKSEHIFTDLKKEQIFEKIDTILQSDLTKFNSVLVFFLTHGLESNILETRKSTFLADDIWMKFVECEQLKNKPKIFIIQACKGKGATVLNSPEKDCLLVPLSTFSSERIHSDILIAFSTLEGKESFRDPVEGTWFIQELCRNFTAYGRRDDIFTLLTRVVKCISKNHYDIEGTEVMKSLPVIISTLQKKFFLNRNKERHFILSLKEKHEKILEETRNISRKIDDLNRNKNGKDNQ